MPETKIEKEVSEIHRDVEEIKEKVDMLVDSYIEMQHAKLADKGAFVSLDEYRKKNASRS